MHDDLDFVFQCLILFLGLCKGHGRYKHKKSTNNTSSRFYSAISFLEQLLALVYKQRTTVENILRHRKTHVSLAKN